MKAFYFNTGVTPASESPLFGEFQVWKDGTKQIIFYCENVPDNAQFMFACDYPDLSQHHTSNDVIVVPIIKGGLLSKYAYFKV